MKMETFKKKQAERFEKFVAKRETAKAKHEYIIANANGELWYGNQSALSRVICEEFNEAICGDYRFMSQMLDSFKRSMSEFAPAEVTEGTSSYAKKVYKLSTPFGDAFINPKLLPVLPSNSIFMVSKVKPEKTPVWVICEDIVIGLICPIYNCDFTE